jgi:hypothetical protein
MVNINAAMFANERDAGGQLKVQVHAGVPYEQLWLCGGTHHGRVKLLGKLSISSWYETQDVATAIGEAIEFTCRKKREAITELWCNELASDELALALAEFATPEVGPQENYQCP